MPQMTRINAGLITLLAVLVTTNVYAKGDVKAGEAVFLVCKACHSLKPGEANIGPTLYGVMGRRSGSVAGYEYSEAMKSANKLWDVKTLDAYIANPPKYIPNNKMAFAGLMDPRDRQDLITYLNKVSKKH